jgi:D-alanine-D-alanine ligase
VDVALPQMFCRPGMTAYRSLLTDVLGVPTVGNTGEVMAIGAHKQRARAIVAAAGVAVPEGEVLRPGDVPTLAPPVVVKPVDADNSHGVTLVRDPSEYDAALATAFEHAGPSAEVLVETYVELGREVRCGIVERPTEDGVELVCLPLEEYAVDADTKPVRDAADKITRSADTQDLRLMAKDADHAWIVPLDDPTVPAVHELARRAHVALGCRDHSLVDVRIDPHGTPYFLEASLYCSFAPSSVVVMMAAAAGLPLETLLADQVAAAVARGASGFAGLSRSSP